MKYNCIYAILLPLKGVTIEDMEAFIPRMLTRFFIDSLMYGNLTKDVRRL